MSQGKGREIVPVSDKHTLVLSLTENEALDVLQLLAEASDRQDTATLRRLEPIALDIGIGLFRLGGIARMTQALQTLPSAAAQRIVGVLWLGIPGWIA